jgi:phosphate uptake regulator
MAAPTKSCNVKILLANSEPSTVLGQSRRFRSGMLFCAKNIERMGDHATNIAETMHYVVEGRSLPDERPKSDLMSFARMPLRK